MEDIVTIIKSEDFSYINKDEYGGIVQFDNGTKAKDTVYSDRMYSWDYKKYNECCQKIWNNEGQSFYNSERRPEEVQQFLRLYTGNDSLTLCRIVRYKRMDGYSVWRFDYTIN